MGLIATRHSRALFRGLELARNPQTRDQGIRKLQSIRDADLDREDIGLKHVGLAIAFRKKKMVEQMDFHWRKAIEADHSTGLAYEGLAISLTKQRRLEEAAAVCQALIDHPTIPGPRSYLAKDAMRKRLGQLKKMIARDG